MRRVKLIVEVDVPDSFKEGPSAAAAYYCGYLQGVVAASALGDCNPVVTVAPPEAPL